MSMGSIQLVRQVNSEKDRDRQGLIFFQIGEMTRVRRDLMALLNRRDGPFYGRVLYTYNGVKILVDIGDIPNLLRLLLSEGFQVYSVYEVYEP